MQSFLVFDGVCFAVVVLPVPVNAQSDTPSSNRRGELRAMFDLGESRTEVLDIDRVNRDIKLPPWIDSAGAPGTSAIWRVGVRGEGVRGIRPPAVRVEKIPLRLLTGVKTAGLAMSGQCLY